MNASVSHLVVICALSACAVSLASQSWAPVSPTGFGGAVVTDTTRGRLLAWGGLRGTLGNANWLDETWWVDAQGFQLAAAPGAPAPLGNGWLAHDAVRGRTVLFGSVSPTGVRLNETWEHDGTAWQRILVGNAPPVPNDAGLAYVPALGGCMLVTGNGQHWRYDGVTWQPLAIGQLPPSRTRFGLALDPLRQRLVLFGGFFAQLYLADTWEFDGLAWTQIMPVASPPAAVARLVFDPVRGRVLARIGESVVAQEWEYDGLTWSQLPMVASVPWSGAQQLAVNPVTGGAVLATGSPEQSPHARFAELVGTSWIPWDPSVAPPAAFDARIARDVRRDRWLLFGGRTEEAASSANARSWQRSGGLWYPIEAIPAPSARFAHGFVHDEARDRTGPRGRSPTPGSSRPGSGRCAATSGRLARAVASAWPTIRCGNARCCSVAKVLGCLRASGATTAPAGSRCRRQAARRRAPTSRWSTTPPPTACSCSAARRPVVAATRPGPTQPPDGRW